MKIKKLYYLCLVLLCASSCSKEDNFASDKSEELKTTSVGLLEFTSREELREFISKSNNSIQTKSSNQDIQPLNSDISISTINNDPILSVEIDDSTKNNIKGNYVNIYSDLGYEDLIPEEAFARTLNIRGEYAINDTIYKVSPRGTFCFPKNLIQLFEKEYAKIYYDSATYAGNGFYNYRNSSNLSKELSENLRLFDTFENGTIANKFSVDQNVTKDIIDTRSASLPNGHLDSDWIEALDIDWDSFESHTTDAHTVAGKWIQSLFGRNKAFNVSFANNRRLKTKLYYYNYVGYTSIGCKAKFQKKNTIGWSGKTADHIYLIWSNIIIKSALPYSIEYPHTFKPTTRKYIGSNIETIPGLNVNGTVDYYVGMPLSDKELKILASENYLNAVIELKMEVDKDFDSNPRQVGAIKYVCDNAIWTIIRPYGKHIANGETVDCNFESDFHFTVGIKDFTPGIDYDIKEWISKISAKKLNSPELIQGEVRSAATKNNETKGIRLIKIKK